MMCRGKDGEVDSHLQIVSLENGEGWVIHYADYANGTEYSRRNMIYPHHWSKDGRYLYATSQSIASGCCWIGGDVLLVRLNMETGTQTEIVNFIVDGWPTMTEFSFSPSDNYLLYIPQDGKDNLHLLDLNTWKQRIIEIEYENTGAGHLLMSNNDKKVILVIAQYPEEYQGDLRYGWLVVIDLESGSQKKLIGGMDYFETPIPIRWEDDFHVLLRNLWINDDMYWLLNIHTAELTETENP